MGTGKADHTLKSMRLLVILNKEFAYAGAIGRVAGVVHFISGHEQTQLNLVYNSRFLMYSLLSKALNIKHLILFNASHVL